MKQLRVALPLTILMLLQACVHTPNQSADQHALLLLNQAHLQEISKIKQFTLKGRVGVQTEGKGFSGGINWQHQPELDEISLYSPLGGEVAHIQKTNVSVQLTDSHGSHLSADNIESLTTKTLGWQLPLTGLADWALGRSRIATISSSTLDDEGHLRTLKQDGWEIEYQNYSAVNSTALPHQITLRNNKVFLKLLVNQWSTQTQENPDSAL